MMFIVKGAWSDGNQSSGWILWLVSSTEFDYRKNRLITELELFSLLEY